jgi:hypothetical protein
MALGPLLEPRRAAAGGNLDDGRILEAVEQRASARLGGSGGGLASMLTPLLDQKRDGSIMDDVTSDDRTVMK